MKHAKTGISKWQVPVRVDAMLEHDTVSRAVHRLESVSGILTFEQEQVVFVVLVVTRLFPEF